MGCHHSHWLSYFSRWLKPPTRSHFWGLPDFDPYQMSGTFLQKHSQWKVRCRQQMPIDFQIHVWLSNPSPVDHFGAYPQFFNPLYPICHNCLISYTIIAPWNKKNTWKKTSDAGFGFFCALGQTDLVQVNAAALHGRTHDHPSPRWSALRCCGFHLSLMVRQRRRGPRFQGWKDLGFRFRQHKIGKPTSLLGYNARYNGDTMGIPRNILQAVAQ